MLTLGKCVVGIMAVLLVSSTASGQMPTNKLDAAAEVAARSADTKRAALHTTADYAYYNRFTKFDQYFSKYSKRHFGVAFDWHYFKAQAIAESNLRPAATSRAGAVGVMQIMPRTYEEIRDKNPSITGSAEQPRWNIAAGIWYDHQNFVMWTDRRPLLDKIKFMLGSYNAGRTSVLRAQRIAEGDGLDGTLWSAIERSLPRVTGRSSGETLQYVNRIINIKEVLQ
jgi:soluble lytic murein transglycosylase-like protein